MNIFKKILQHNDDCRLIGVYENIGEPHREPDPGPLGNKTFLLGGIKCCGKRMLRFRIIQKQLCSNCGYEQVKEIEKIAVCQVCGKTDKLFRLMSPY